ncbi:arylesterase [Oceanibium sediminis]|uniref:arylesterase n=1 Tax=Oceanibium sediminis TaxID=2026339 RepID=UPI000DD47939|nr:arylesterase [Oceanibium sediminis]
MKALSAEGVAFRYGAARAGRKLGVAGMLALVTGVTAAAADQITIAALGDSLTQGYGLAEEDGFVPRLEAWLNEHSGYAVTLINAGVSGDTTAGGRARIDWTLSEEVDGVIVALGGNDLLRGIDPAVTRENLDVILGEIAARDLPAVLAGVPAPSNYGPDYKAAFDGIFPELAEKHGAILYPSFLAGLGTGEDVGAARSLMQGDGIHPNAEGVAAIVADIGPVVLELVERAAE